MNYFFDSDGVRLAGHLAEPPGSRTNHAPGLVICHGFPSGGGGAANSGKSFPELADRIATEMDWVVLTMALRGCGQSEGNFSLDGWLDDIHAAVEHLRSLKGIAGVWLAGFGTGGALCICEAARNDSVRGVAAMAAPADFDDWATNPRRLLLHAQEVGAIRSADFPESFDRWSRQLKAHRSIACVEDLAPRPLLVVHGSDDDLVPVFDARVLSDAHASAELRIIDGAGHQLRHDPRAIAVLLGWLDRQRRRLT
ncbi:MAG: hypothetical protein JJLCMIEE_03388 [Acidimicrobiales bacterium]|nr:MAG: alpha/beta fold hydrolase [Actinomycetota bacterium]MBV6510257.1 hypothetical protein [Acidimicrobiales bacterium]RIK04221.1 MAG: hypothetical protein DCC48_14100 [Acidobacteriota bacterium]